MGTWCSERSRCACNSQRARGERAIAASGRARAARKADRPRTLERRTGEKSVRGASAPHLRPDRLPIRSERESKPGRTCTETTVPIALARANDDSYDAISDTFSNTPLRFSFHSDTLPSPASACTDPRQRLRRRENEGGREGGREREREMGRTARNGEHVARDAPAHTPHDVAEPSLALLPLLLALRRRVRPARVEHRPRPRAPRVLLRPHAHGLVLPGRGEVGLADADRGGPRDVAHPVRVAREEVLRGVGRPLLGRVAAGVIERGAEREGERVKATAKATRACARRMREEKRGRCARRGRGSSARARRDEGGWEKRRRGRSRRGREGRRGGSASAQACSSRRRGRSRARTHLYAQILTNPSHPPVAKRLTCWSASWPSPPCPGPPCGGAPPALVRAPMPTAGAQLTEVTPCAWAGKRDASQVPSSASTSRAGSA